MAGPSGSSGGQKGEGFKFGIGTYLATEWWDQAIVRAANAMAGAISSLFHMVSEPVKQVYDLGGGTIDAIGRASGWFDYEHKWASGVGQMGNVGVGGVFKGMGQSIVQSPGRILEAAERGDYYGFGREAMNGYILGRSAAGMAKGTSSFMYNRGVGLIGKYGGARGQAWRAGVREKQIQRMEAAANEVLQRGGYRGRPVEYSYGGEGPKGFVGSSEFGNRIPAIYESAFTPGLRRHLPQTIQCRRCRGLDAHIPPSLRAEQLTQREHGAQDDGPRGVACSPDGHDERSDVGPVGTRRNLKRPNRVDAARHDWPRHVELRDGDSDR